MTVTAICTLWGRPLHSLRWMWHMNRIRFPHPIILADGGPEEGLEQVLRDKSLFPNLDYTYLRFRDRSVDDYFRKVIEASEQARTPYVMLCDNDDFVLPGGVARSLELLAADPDLIGAGGRIVSFGLTRKHRPQPLDMVAGRVQSWVQGGTFENVDEPTALARVEHQISRKVFGTYYNVLRREVFTESWRRVRASGVTALDIGAGEMLACEALAHGRVAMDAGNVMHLRQLATSSVGNLLPSSAQRWADPKWQADLERMGDSVGAAVAAADGIAVEHAKAEVLAYMRAKRRPKDTDFVPPSGLSAKLRVVLRALGIRATLEHVRIQREHCGAAKTNRRTWEQAMDLLKREGASGGRLDAFAAGLAEIESTLADPAMLEFVQRHAKDIRTP